MAVKDTAAKRKKTVDMPDSPPKRVTRARAAKTVADTEMKPRVTKITTASVKAAADRQKVAVRADTTTSEPSLPVARKRKAKAEDGEKAPVREAVQISEEADQIDQEIPKARARSKKALLPALPTAEHEEAPKLRGKQAKTSTSSKKEDAPKARGRPKKVQQGASIVEAEQVQETEDNVPAKKQTRGRAATGATSTTAAAAPKKASKTAKKVQFQGDPDKENVPIEIVGPKKSSIKATGLRAKPVRKPTVPRMTTRGRKSPEDVAQTEERKNLEPLPLSPKKGFQLAKAGSTSSEDELASEKTPVRFLCQSPSKNRISPLKNTEGLVKLGSDQKAEPSSPSKTMGASVLGSPARRPPQSPFKDALKSSPKKLQFSDSIAQPALLSSKSILPLHKSLLQESPKKVRLEDSVTHAALLPTQTPHKASLLQSPARRPMNSPLKANLQNLPNVSGSTPHSMGSKLPKEFPLFARKDNQSTAMGCSITNNDEQQTASDRQKEEKLLDARRLQSTEASWDEEAKEGVQLEQPAVPVVQRESTESNVSIESPTDNMAVFRGPSFSFPSSGLRRISVESQSDDELASPDKKYAPTPIRKHAVATSDLGQPALNTECVRPTIDDLPMSPLADRLSTWVASSPDKQAPAGRSRQTRGIFSLGAGEMMQAREKDMSDVIIGSPAKISFFEDEMAVTTQQEDVSMTEPRLGHESTRQGLEISQELLASDDYGDENAIPDSAEILRVEQDGPILTCTPAKVFTPAKLISQRRLEIHTVSKVPLRDSAEISPVKLPRQRSKSLGGLAVVEQSFHEGYGPGILNDVGADLSMLPAQPATPGLNATTLPQTPGSVIRLDAPTPGLTARKDTLSNALKGAVVFVDVHTSEGADASGIFIDLLSQMGARCVKQWSWNPRDTLNGIVDGTASPNNQCPESSSTAAKVGITHVVYKDGGKRTLEKVRISDGAVHCVGVGWVLEYSSLLKLLENSLLTMFQLRARGYMA